MKKLFFVIFVMFIGYSSYSQNECPEPVSEFTFYYSKPLVLNQIIDTLFVCDPDIGQTHIWEIEDASGLWSIKTDPLYPTHAYIGAIDEDLVNTDNKSSYTFTVTVTDQGEFIELLSSSATINLIETNGEPIIVDNQIFSIDENLDIGTYVGTVIANDPNEQALTYTILSGDNNNHFEINADTGEIFTTTLLNYENISSYSLVIEVQDTGTVPLSTTGIITINVNNVNEAPIIYR